MSLTFGPMMVMIAVLVSMQIWTLELPGSRIAAAVPPLLAGVAWYAGYRRTGRPLLTFGFGVDHTGPPTKTFEALGDALAGDDELEPEDDDDRAQVGGRGMTVSTALVAAGVIAGIAMNGAAGTAAITVDASHVVGTLDQVALILGRGILAVFGIIFGSILFSEVVRRITSDAPKFGDVSASEPSGSVYDIVQGLEAEVDEDEAKVGSDPGPIAHFDWSVDDPGPDDVHDLKRALERSGYHVHPFPNGPVGGIRDRWVWSEKVLGVWDSEPDWYVRTGEDEDDRELVDPDLSSWGVDTT